MSLKLIAVTATAVLMAAPAVARMNPFPGIYERLDQLNAEDMRVKSGEVNSSTLTLRVEDHSRSQGREEIYGKDVDIDVSSLDQSGDVYQLREYTRLNREYATQTSLEVEATHYGLRQNRAAIASLRGDMTALGKDLSAGVASAIAAGQHQFDPSFSGGQVSLSGGHYNGQNAISFAVGVPLGDRAFFNASISKASRSVGASGGVGVTLQLSK